MALRFKVQLVMIAEDGEETAHELVVLDKEHERIEQLGLSLAEAKLLLRELQQQVLERQVAAFLSSRAACPACGRAWGIKDHKPLRFRTLFGKLELASPRLRRCRCEPHTSRRRSVHCSSCCRSAPPPSCVTWRRSGPHLCLTD